VVRLSMHSLSETQLGACQHLQIGNSCSFHAISAALKLLLSIELDPEKLSAEIDRLWWRFKPMRIFPGWAVTPRQQMRIVKYLAKKYSLPIECSFTHSKPEQLRTTLTDFSSVSLITIIWIRGRAPGIYYGNFPTNLNSEERANAHTMLLGAYYDAHITTNIGSTPWGFINSWANNCQKLFWMKDDEFQRSWNFFMPGIGPFPLVTIRRIT